MGETDLGGDLTIGYTPFVCERACFLDHATRAEQRCRDQRYFENNLAIPCRNGRGEPVLLLIEGADLRRGLERVVRGLFDDLVDADQYDLTESILRRNLRSGQ